MAIKEMANAVALLDPYISAAAISADFSSRIWNVQQFANYAVQVVITSQSSLDVTAIISVSLDGTNFATVPGSSQNFLANGTFVWDTANSAVVFVRLDFTFAAGSANFNIFGFAKTQ